MADETRTEVPARTSRRQLAAVVGVAVAVLAVAGATALYHRPAGPDDAAAAAPASAPAMVFDPAPVIPAPTTFDPNNPPTLPPGASPSPPPPSALVSVIKGLPDLISCEVEPETLLKALRASDLPASVTQASSLTDVQCYVTTAVAATDAGRTVVFDHTKATNTWRAVGGTVAQACAQIPQRVKPHFTRCTTER